MTDQSVIMKTPVSEDKKRLILDAARRLLVQEDFQDIALDAVAREAGVAKGTLFLYYRSKEELFSAVFSELVDRVGRELDAVSASGLRGRALLERAVEAVLTQFEQNHDFMSQFGSGHFPACGSRSRGKLLERFLVNLDRLTAILKRCAGDGLLAPEDLQTSAAFLFGLCRNSIVLQGLLGRKETLERQRRRVVDFFLKGAGR